MRHSHGRPIPLRRVVGTAVLALGVFGLWSCTDDPTRPADPAGFEVAASIQQALVPEDLTETKLVASDGAANDGFGRSVAVSGDVALIGAGGSAYVFEREGGGWTEVEKFTGSFSFGTSVAVKGDLAVVGAPSDHFPNLGQTGAAHVFERSGDIWALEQTLTPGDGDNGDNFGWSVALSDDAVLVGARFHDDDDLGTTSSGAAYLFERNLNDEWQEVEKFAAPAGEDHDGFGWAVALSGDAVLIGAPRAGGSGAGEAYFFERLGGAWGDAAAVVTGNPGDFLGGAVAMHGEQALISARGDDDRAFGAGAVYVFQRDAGTWGEAAKLTASDGAFADGLGSSVVLSGQAAVVGAHVRDEGGVNSGAAYVFERTDGTWADVESAKLVPSDGGDFHFFGFSVGMSDDAVLVGASRGDGNVDGSGAAYVFHPSSVTPVAIDIKPGSDDNPLSLRGTTQGRGQSSGTLPVAVLTTSTVDGDDVDFDATTADPATITLGDDDGDDTPVAERRNGTLKASVEDVDGDGDDDLILHFDQAALVDNGDLDENTTELILNGETMDGTAITGSDVVLIVGH